MLRAKHILLVFFLAVFLWPSPSAAVPHADFHADLVYEDEGRPARACGSAMTAGAFARFDVRLGKAGDFTLLVDMEGRMIRVLSQRLKAYVETKLEGDPRSWRDLVKSCSSILMPQTLGMVSLEEKDRRVLGREVVQGYTAERSRNVFRLGFLGSCRDITADVWESDVLVPFPLKVEILESRDTRRGSAYLIGITPSKGREEFFQVPEDFTRYSSVMDLILYALSAF